MLRFKLKIQEFTHLQEPINARFFRSGGSEQHSQRDTLRKMNCPWLQVSPPHPYPFLSIQEGVSPTLKVTSSIHSSFQSKRAFRLLSKSPPPPTLPFNPRGRSPTVKVTRYPPVNYRQLPATPGHTVYNTTYSRIASTRSPAFGDQYYWRYFPEFEGTIGKRLG